MPPSKTSPVQLVCASCSATFRTRIRGRSTKCPHCGTGRYVRQSAQWEGPVTAETRHDYEQAALVSNRLPVWCSCACGHQWQSRARDSQRLRCPSCREGYVRVPHRTHTNTGPVPEGHLPPPPPPRITPRRAPAGPVWEPEDEWEPDESPRPSLADVLAGALAAFRSTPAPARAPVRRAAAPHPARSPRPTPQAAPNPPALPPIAPRTASAGAAVQPIDPQTLPEPEQRRRDYVCQIVGSLFHSLRVWYNQPLGLCEALDLTQPAELRRCPRTRTHAVRFQTSDAHADAFTCAAHTRPLAATADRAPYITATIYRLR